MKRFFIFLMCNSLLTMSSFAQFHKIGEAFVKDVVPCIVINVDESGKHGLAMSLVPKPKALKAAKKTGEHKWFYIQKKTYRQRQETDKRVQSRILQPKQMRISENKRD